MFEYESLDLRLPQLPTRSRLFDLEPVGVGTPYVESLTGYISRLAESHCVLTSTLLWNVILPNNDSYQFSKKSGSVLESQSSFTAALNGKGVTAKNMVQALEKLTSRKNLYCLTMLTWRNDISTHNLIRRTRAWCPSCYECWREAGAIIYEPLLWSLDAVKVCAVHRRCLALRCLHCGEESPILCPRSRPGHCPKCECWLGASEGRADPSSKRLSEEEIEFQSVLVDDLGELLASMRLLISPPCKGTLARSVSFCVDKIAMGNAEKLARLIRMPCRMVGYWKAGEAAPRLGTLILLSNRLSISSVNLLTGNITDLALSVKTFYEETSVDRKVKSFRKKQNWDKELAILKAAETECPPPPLAMVVQRMDKLADGVRPSVGRIRGRFPVLCSSISRRYAEDKRLQSLTRMRELMMKIIEDNECEAPSMNEVSRQMAMRLGLHKMPILYLLFPELCHEIAARHKAYQLKKREEAWKKLREDVRRAAIALHSQNIQPSRKRVRKFLRLRCVLSDPGRIALREIKRELGYD